MIDEPFKKSKVVGWTDNPIIRQDPIYNHLAAFDFDKVKAAINQHNHKNSPDPKDPYNTIFLIATEKVILERDSENRQKGIQILKYLAENEPAPFLCSILGNAHIAYNPFWSCVVDNDLEVFEVLLHTKNLPPMFEELLISAIHAVDDLNQQARFCLPIKNLLMQKYPNDPNAWNKFHERLTPALQQEIEFRFELQSQGLYPVQFSSVEIILEQLKTNQLFKFPLNINGLTTEAGFYGNVQPFFKALQEQEQKQKEFFPAAQVKQQLSDFVSKYPGLSANYKEGIKQIETAIDEKLDSYKPQVTAELK